MAPCGIMFHHFHGKAHPPQQGSISAEQLKGIIARTRRERRLLCAGEFAAKAANVALADDDVCLTFDDALKCQIDVALPVLREMSLTAFWFIYTSPLVGTPEVLEVFRHFRCTAFNSVNEFYDAFFMRAGVADRLDEYRAEYKAAGFLEQFTFYSEGDRLFRYLRDVCMSGEQYNAVVRQMMSDRGYNPNDHLDGLWLNAADMLELKNEGHIIGLHSHSHPTRITKLGQDGQLAEYSENKRVLEAIVGEVSSVSYPCNDTDEHTDGIMRRLCISVGFDAVEHEYTSALHIPRIDHAYLK